MRLFTAWVLAAGLVFSVTTANAQSRAPDGSATYTPVSDISGPYAAMPPGAAPPPPRGPMLLPPTEVYTVLREGGFRPLGIPRQRGLVYTISVIDRGGEDGRLVIDARNGRIVRFMPAYRMGNYRGEDLTASYGPVGPVPPTVIRGVPRPPGLVPHLASRTVPVPKPSPLAARPVPEPPRQAAAEQVKPAETPQSAPPAAAPPVDEAKPPEPAILPTQEMPKVQDLE